VIKKDEKKNGWIKFPKHNGRREKYLKILITVIRLWINHLPTQQGSSMA
jgi:hypothetical protein